MPVFPCVGKSSEGVDRFWQPLAKREFRTPQNTDHFPVSNVGRIRHLDDVEQQHLIMTFDLAVIPLFAFFFLWKKSPKQNKWTKMKRRRRKSVFLTEVSVWSPCVKSPLIKLSFWHDEVTRWNRCEKYDTPTPLPFRKKTSFWSSGRWSCCRCRTNFANNGTSSID